MGVVCIVRLGHGMTIGPPSPPPGQYCLALDPGQFRVNSLGRRNAGTLTHRAKKIEERYSRNALTAAGEMQKR